MNNEVCIKKKGEKYSTSVVLSAYNGVSYIIEQLESIKNQTVSPSEVLIFDDCSTDNTYNLVRSFIVENKIEDTWIIKKNEVNLGWRKSFRNAIARATSDIIFLCDQDDIWDTKKIEEMVKVFESNDNIDLLACGYTPFYNDKGTKRVSSKIIQTMKYDNSIEQIVCDSKFMHVIRPGCTYAVKREFCDLIEPFWNGEIAHDAMIWRAAILKGTAYYLHMPLINWRRYSLSSSNPASIAKNYSSKNELNYCYLIDAINSHILNMEDLLRMPFLSEKAEKILKTNYEFETEYFNAVKNYSTTRMTRLFFEYNHFFFSNKTIISDLVVVIKYRFFLLANK